MPAGKTRIVLLALHTLLAGMTLLGAILDPSEFAGVGSVAFLLLFGVVWGLVARHRLVILPAIILLLAGTLMTAFMTLGNIAWPESLVTRVVLIWILFSLLEISVIVTAVVHFGPKRTTPQPVSPEGPPGG